MKRALGLALALAVLVALAATYGPAALMSSDTVRARIEADLSARFAARVEVGARPHLAFVPRPRLILEGARLRDRDGTWTLAATRISARLDLSDLLVGEIRLAEASLAGGTLRLEARAGAADPTSSARVLHRLLQHRVTVEGLALAIGADAPPLLRDLAVTIVPRGAGASLRGSLRIADQTVEVSVRLANIALLSGPGSSALAATVSSSLARLELDGTLSGMAAGERPRFDGRVDLASSDLRGVAARIGQPLPGWASFGAMRVGGRGIAGPDGLDLEAATLELDGNTGEGRLAVALAPERPGIQATLAFDAFDGTAYAQDLVHALATGDASVPDPERSLFGKLTRMDVDLRLSMGSLTLGDLETGPAALTLLLQDGDASLEVSETRIAGGIVTLAARVRPDAQAGYSATLRARARDLALAGLPLPATLAEARAGQGSGMLDLAARGASLADLLRGSSGRAELTFRAVELRGADIDAALTHLQSREAVRTPGGTSRLETVDLALDIAPRRIGVTRLAARTPRHDVSLAGAIDPYGWTLALKGSLGAASDADPASPETLPETAQESPSETAADVENDIGAGPWTGNAPEGADPASPGEARASGAARVPVFLSGTLLAPRLLPDLTDAGAQPVH